MKKYLVFSLLLLVLVLVGSSAWAGKSSVIAKQVLTVSSAPGAQGTWSDWVSMTGSSYVVTVSGSGVATVTIQRRMMLLDGSMSANTTEQAITTNGAFVAQDPGDAVFRVGVKQADYSSGAKEIGLEVCK